MPKCVGQALLVSSQVLMSWAIDVNSVGLERLRARSHSSDFPQAVYSGYKRGSLPNIADPK